MLEKNISNAKRDYIRKKIAKAGVLPVLRVELEVPVEVVSRQNTRRAGSNWSKAYRNKVRQQGHLGGYLRVSGLQKALVDLIPTQSKCRVTLTRLGGVNVMDQDNLVYAFKHVRDLVAQGLGRDDRESENLEWVCDQMPQGEPGIRIVIERFL